MNIDSTNGVAHDNARSKFVKDTTEDTLQPFHSISLEDIRALGSNTREQTKSADSSNDISFVDYSFFKSSVMSAAEIAERKFCKGDGKQPDKPSFIPEDVNEHEEEWLKEVVKDKTKIAELKKEINKTGKDPATVVVEAVKDNKVVMLGEQHVPSPNGLRKMIAETIPKMKEAGATHFAIEWPAKYQDILDRFMKTGEFTKEDMEKLPKPFFDPDYVEVLKAARKAGLKLVAVDSDDQSPSADREKTIADNIKKIVKADDKNKVVVLCGMLHAIDGDHHEDKYPRAGKILRKEEIPTAIFGSEVGFGRPPSSLYPFSCGVKKPVAVPTKGEIGKLPLVAKKGQPYPLSQFDQVLIFPAPADKEKLPPYHVRD